MIAVDKSAEALPDHDVAAAKIAADHSPGLAEREGHIGAGAPFAAFCHHKTPIVQAVSGRNNRYTRRTGGMLDRLFKNKTADWRRHGPLSLFHGLTQVADSHFRHSNAGTG